MFTIGTKIVSFYGTSGTIVKVDVKNEMYVVENNRAIPFSQCQKC